MIKKYPPSAEAAQMNTSPIKTKTPPREDSIPNFIGLLINSFIESIQETQKLSLVIAIQA